MVAVLQLMISALRKMTISYLNLNRPFNFLQTVEDNPLPSVLLWKESENVKSISIDIEIIFKCKFTEVWGLFVMQKVMTLRFCFSDIP